jgi:hypothetical protein
MPAKILIAVTILGGMTRLRAGLVRLSQMQVMHRVFVECLDAQRATKRDHPRARFDVAQSAALIDGLLQTMQR